MVGQVVKWVRYGGFGFIKTAPGLPDIYVHNQALPPGMKALPVKQRVRFLLSKAPGGVEAIQVELLEPSVHCGQIDQPLHTRRARD